jgi:lysophospholipase L1-like esterase
LKLHTPLTHFFATRLLPVLVCSLLCGDLLAGDSLYARYPFLHLQYKRLFFSKDSSSFLKLYKKMDQLKEDKNVRVNMVHMGGSHVQGGTWSNAFVSAFQNEYRTAGGGYFVFPYKIARTNGQPYATSFSDGKWKRCRAVGKEFCLPLGMNAISITTNDSANYFGVALTRRAACKYVNTVKVYHNFNPSFEFRPALKDSFKVDRKEYKKNGYTLFRFDMPVDSVIFELVRIDTLNRDFILYGFSLENNMTAGFYMAGLGANGASSSSFLRAVDLVPQLESIEGDVFILSLGVNDTQSKAFGKEEYIENYDTLITLIRRANPDAAIILTTTTDNFIRYKNPNRRTVTAREAMFELMDKHQVAVWDLFSLMGGYRSMLRWQKEGLASKDKVHFTNRGYTLLGQLMYDALNTSYLNYQKKENDRLNK